MKIYKMEEQRIINFTTMNLKDILVTLGQYKINLLKMEKMIEFTETKIDI